MLKFIKLSLIRIKNKLQMSSAAKEVTRRNIVLFGAPGVGKGTYGRLIRKEFGIPTFSMGDYFRKVIHETESHKYMDEEELKFVHSLHDTLRKGHFVTDEQAIHVIDFARNQTFKKEPILILDGVPRTVEQARRLPEYGISIDLVMNFYS